MDIKSAIAQLVQKKDLCESDMITVMNEIMGGEATPAQIGSFLTALHLKGETIEEISGAAQVMRQKATAIDTGVDMSAGGIVVDTCGTGGSGSGVFNVSTTSAFVVAAAGGVVAKHGNRSITSKCGSADVLEAAGVALDLTPDQVGQCIQEVGVGFLFAPALHGAMKYAIGPRREIGIRTVFNILGPLTNPAGANVQVLGVFDKDLTTPLAEVLGKLGSKRALVVHGAGKLDEITTTGTTTVAELKEGKVTTYTVTPEDFGLKRADVSELQGGSSGEESAAQMRGILSGQQGAKRDMVLLNAGAALMVAGKAETIAQGIHLAAEMIDSGKALAKMDQLCDVSKKMKEQG